MEPQPVQYRTIALKRRMMQTKARILSNSCPEEWSSTAQKLMNNVLHNYGAEKEISEEWELYLHNVINYRFDATTIADRMVEEFSLPRPFGQRCRPWDSDKWCRETIIDCDRYRSIYRLLRHHGLVWDGSSQRGGYFSHPQRYLAATLFDSRLDRDAIRATIEKMGVYLKESSEDTSNQEQDDAEDWEMVESDPVPKSQAGAANDGHSAPVSHDEEPVLVSLEDGFYYISDEDAAPIGHSRR